MRRTQQRERPRHEERSLDYADSGTLLEKDPLLTESAVTVQDDEEEVFDLGFIIEDRDDRRDTLLASWQRLDDMDTDEALETDPKGPLPEEVDRLEWEGVPAREYPTDARVGTVDAEADEEDFAGDNQLVDDPYESPQVDRYGLDVQSEEEDLDDDDVPEAVAIRGRAPGVVRGLGTTITQDIGAGGFSVEENPLAVWAADLEDEEPGAPARPEAGPSPRHDLPKPEMGLPQPVRMPEPGETTPPPGEKTRTKKPSRPNGKKASR